MTLSPSIILQTLSRDELVQFADLLALEVADRRAKAPLVEVLSDVDVYELAELLNTLPRARLKELCRGLGLDDSGKAKASLVERLVARARDGASKPAGDERRNTTSKPRPPTGPATSKTASPTTRKPTPTMTTNASQLAAYIWSLADLLRGDFKQSQYGRIILPFTLLRRLECVLEPTKDKVLKELQKRESMSEEGREKFLLKAAGAPEIQFYNTSPMDLSKLGSTDIESNLRNYVQSFSRDAREIFEHFRFDEFVRSLAEANLLFKVVKRVASMDLHPNAVSNHEMGIVFEELIRREPLVRAHLALTLGGVVVESLKDGLVPEDSARKAATRRNDTAVNSGDRDIPVYRSRATQSVRARRR